MKNEIEANDAGEEQVSSHREDHLVRYWVNAEQDLPNEGEWVLHSYYGVRPPEYGIFINGRFRRRNGPETLPATHWLRIPSYCYFQRKEEISSPNIITECPLES